MPADRFFKNLEKDSDLFSVPFAWGDFDAFEDLLSRLKSKENNGFVVTDNIFAQCWNAGHECDGMWKNYTSSQLDDGVMIESDSNTILSSLKNIVSKFKMFESKEVYLYKSEIESQVDSMVSVEKVDYLTHKEIISQYEEYFEQLDKVARGESSEDDLSFLDSTGEGLRKILSIKREHYSYEKEFRIFIQPFDDGAKEFEHIDVHRILVPDFKSRIKKVIFSPKMGENKYKCYKSQLIQEYGFDENKIEKSKMYDLDELLRGSKLKRKGSR
ncbi:DUF2971 domain-containing protein [Flexistipes sinusarabici]|nr:DUF2971 domain-containing protein [Flexistipes sinusarabici]